MSDPVASILQAVAAGSLDPEAARKAIAESYRADLGFASLDTRRAERTGYPEAVYCAGKTLDQAEAIIARLREEGVGALGTRASPELAARVLARFPEGSYDASSRILAVGGVPEDKREGLVAVVCAGTSDLPVAREAGLTAAFYGSRVLEVNDVGVAGIHRLFARLPEIRKANAVVVAAGMEGALAGVVAALVEVPVIALPTSVGYGAAFGGVAALLGMLSSCAPGISTVNIDNGFGAGYLANLINRRARA